MCCNEYEASIWASRIGCEHIPQPDLIPPLFADMHSDGLEGGTAESDETLLSDLRGDSTDGRKQCSALEGVLVLRFGQKRVLENCLSRLTSRSRNLESKRKR